MAEGVLTSRSAHHLAQKQGIDCPTIEGIYHVSCVLQSTALPAAGPVWFPLRAAHVVRRTSTLSANHAPALKSFALFPQVVHESKDPLQVVTENMSRPLKPEVSRKFASGVTGTGARPVRATSGGWQARLIMLLALPGTGKYPGGGGCAAHRGATVSSVFAALQHSALK